MSRLIKIAGWSGAKAFLAMGCFGAMAYFAFVAFTGDQASRPALPVEPDALQEPARAVVAPLQAPTVEQRQTDQAIAALIDKLENGIARGPSGSQPEENAAALLGRIMTLEASASPDGLQFGYRHVKAVRSAGAGRRSCRRHRRGAPAGIVWPFALRFNRSGQPSRRFIARSCNPSESTRGSGPERPAGLASKPGATGISKFYLGGTD